MLGLVNHVLFYLSYDGWSDLSKLHVIFTKFSPLSRFASWPLLTGKQMREKTI
jgi:hypothetical protein